MRIYEKGQHLLEHHKFEIKQMFKILTLDVKYNSHKN